jgi:L-threonylcarbamoyladenylate synthase
MSRKIYCPGEENNSFPSGSMDEIKEIYSLGELFVYPTETLYGLGANPFDEDALDKVYSVKNRPGDMPISVAVSDISMMARLGKVNETARRIAKRFLPGPVTLILFAENYLSDTLLKDDKIGIRIPDHRVALKIIDSTGPITSTSANVHGGVNPYNIDEAFNQLGDGVKLYIDSGESRLRGSSTIVDCTRSPISIIRKGVIPEEEITALFH